MINKNRIAIVFLAVPEGTRYKVGAYSWVPIDKGKEYIESGMGLEWNPKTGEPEETVSQPWDKSQHTEGPKEIERIETVETILPTPSMENTKKEIEQYLDSEGIEYNEYATKSELLELI